MGDPVPESSRISMCIGETCSYVGNHVLTLERLVQALGKHFLALGKHVPALENVS